MCRHQGTPHYLYARVRRYAGDTRDYKLARSRVSARKRRSQAHTYTCTMPQSGVPYDRARTSSSLPQMWHILTAWRLSPHGGLCRGILPWYIACRKFGCAFSVHKFIAKFPAAVYRHIRPLSLFRALSRAAVRSDYLSIRTTSIAPRIHARWIKEKKNDGHKYEPRREPANVHVEYLRRFLSRRRQRIEFDFKNLIAVCLNLYWSKDSFFYSRQSWGFNSRLRYKQFIYLSRLYDQF